jgi:integrase
MTTRRTQGTGSLTTLASAKGELSWYGRWHDENGARVSRKLGRVRHPGSKVGLTENAAEKELQRRIKLHVAAAPKAASSEDGPMTFTRADTIYRRHLTRQGRKRTTIVAVESCMRVWVIPFFDSGRPTPMENVSWREIEDLIVKMEDKGLTAKSIHNYIGTISALYRYGINPRRRWSTTNPVDGAELPAVKKSTEIRFLTLEEVRALIRHVPDGPYGPLDRVLYLVAAMTGLREGELVALRWMDCDWIARKVRVRANYVLGEFDTPKSELGSRGVPMALEVAQALAAWQPRDSADKDLVFPDPITGGPMSNAAILRRYRKALKAADLANEHVFHDLRHTFGTRAAAAGVPMRTLQAWMGHRDYQTTMRYADYSPSDHETDMIDKAFTSGMAPAECESRPSGDDDPSRDGLSPQDSPRIPVRTATFRGHLQARIGPDTDIAG